MKKSTLAGSTAIAFLVSGVGAFAQVTPEEVWENWKSYTAQSGTEITAQSETRDGDTLVITGVSMNSTADAAAGAAGRIDEMRFKDLGDGTVEITMSDSYTMVITAPAVDGIEPPVAQEMTMSISAPGAVTIASGTPDALAYDFTMPSIEAAMATAADATDPVNFKLSAVNATGSYLVEGTDQKSASGDLAAESLALAFTGKDSVGGSDVEMTAAVGAIESSFSATILEPAKMEDMGAALADGFAVSFDTAYGATSFTLNVTEADKPTSITGGVDSGSFAFSMDAEAFAYDSASVGLNLSIASAEIPFPEVKLGLGEGAFGFSMPTTPSEEPSDFTFLAKLVDLSVSDEIWGMIDPGAALPHDPASVIIDTKGTAKLTSNLFAPENMTSDALPGELLSFDLTQLLARVAGAELTGTGAFTFDNTDVATYGGMPAPTGKIDLKVTGANRLIDTLIAMGLLSEEDAMGGRMMLSMFANPGAGEDEFTSVLEFKDKGFFANGQQLQ